MNVNYTGNPLSDAFLLIAAMYSELLKALNPIFEYFSLLELSLGLLVVSLSARFLLSPWLMHGSFFSLSSNSNTVKKDPYVPPDIGSNVPRLETRGFDVK